MRAPLTLMIAASTIALATAAKADTCPDWFPDWWPGCLHSHGTASYCIRSVTVSDIEALESPPRYSSYKFQVTDASTPTDPSIACPPTKIKNLTASWNRKTGVAQEGAKSLSCSKSPWTGQGPGGVMQCAVAVGDSNAGFPSTASILSADQRFNLLHVQEPLHTTCERIKPATAFTTPAKVNDVTQVKVAHHEFQNVTWRILWQDPQKSAAPVEISAPPLAGPTPVLTSYSDRRIAETTRWFRLDKAGTWQIIATATPNSIWAGLIGGSSHECSPAWFVVK